MIRLLNYKQVQSLGLGTCVIQFLNHADRTMPGATNSIPGVFGSAFGVRVMAPILMTDTGRVPG